MPTAATAATTNHVERVTQQTIRRLLSSAEIAAQPMISADY
jgi:hypothetical protein